MRYLLALLLGVLTAECFANEPAELKLSEPPQLVWTPPAEPALEDGTLKRGTYQPKFKSEWTWPGGSKQSLRSHLARTHGIPSDVLATMTLAQLRAVHNSDHDGMLDRAELRAGEIGVVPMPADRRNVGCPSGACPTGRVVPRRVFRIFRR